MATKENSAATKNPVAKIRSRTASRPSAVVMCAGYVGVNPVQVLLAAGATLAVVSTRGPSVAFAILVFVAVGELW
jgi:hypothetical protein